MDPDMYNAAMEGEMVYGDFSLVDHLTNVEENDYQVTPNRNTILHVAALFGQRNFVREVLKHTPTVLLCYQNKKNETALHIAANVGQSEVISELLSIEGKETLVRMTDDTGDTALHKAVRSGHTDIVKILMELLLDPEHDFPANKAGETPLYLAAESGFYDALKEILKVCRETTYVTGPFNRTPLHVAVIQKHKECARALWQWNKHLCEEADEWGWNSLHYAVKQGLTEIVFDMLGWNKYLAYGKAGSENDWTTVFHIAASDGYKLMISVLLIRCPDCWDMVDSNGQNALHVAILNGHLMLVNELFKLNICNSLIDEADNEGNTPLHLLAAHASGNYVPQAILDHPRANKMVFNKQNHTPLDIASSRITTTTKKLVADLCGINARSGQRCDLEVKRQTESSRKIQLEEMRKEYDNEKAKREKLAVQKILKATETQVVVVTLIMTVAFAAGFTLPGGLDTDDGTNKGMAILFKKTAFRAFVISDVVAFTCAAGAIYIYSAMANGDLIAGEIDMHLLRVLWMDYGIAGILQYLAIGAAVVAFITGMYATLANSIALAVSVCVIASLSFTIFFWVNTTWNTIRRILLKKLDN